MRIQLFSVPNYLRTKLSLELEGKQKERWELAEKEGGPTLDKIKAFNQMLSGAMTRVNEVKEELEERRTKTGTSEWSMLWPQAPPTE